MDPHLRKVISQENPSKPKQKQRMRQQASLRGKEQVLSLQKAILCIEFSFFIVNLYIL